MTSENAGRSPTGMSPPPPVPPQYAHPAQFPSDARNGIAIAALVCGILGMGCPFLSILALIFGIIGIMRARRYATGPGLGLAIAGTVLGSVGLLLVPLGVAILLPSLSRARELAKRTVCANHLQLAGQAAIAYANDSLDFFPVAPYNPHAEAPERHRVRYIGRLGDRCGERTLGNQDPPGARGPDESSVHPSRSLFLLISQGLVTPAEFVCPGSGDIVDPLTPTAAGTGQRVKPGVDRFDFLGYWHLSFGYQMPFGARARPSVLLDRGMALLADKGPYFEVGGSHASTGGVRDRPSDRQAPAFNEAPEKLAEITSDRWRPYNSRNHQGEGQNVLYVDGHVDFQKRPTVGVDYDNIYTLQGGPSLESVILGLSPAQHELRAPLTNTDNVIVP